MEVCARSSIIATSLLVSVCSAGAADLPVKPAVAFQPQSAAETWQFTVMPYFWAPSLNGTSSIRGRTADVDLTFLDMVERSQIPKDLFGLMGYFEARKGPWSLFSDLAYFRISDSRSLFRERSLAPGISGQIAASAEGTVKMFIGEGVAAYEIARFGSPVVYSAFDVYAGIRGWWQEGSASLAISARLNIHDLEISGGRAIARSGDVSWVDPLVGLRWRYQFAPDKQFVVRGDVGGFGVGSDMSWQAVALFDWEFCRTQNVAWKAVVGYRALSVDYAQGSGRTLYRYDILQHGPIFGISATF
jgi:hypothetical protein